MKFRILVLSILISVRAFSAEVLVDQTLGLVDQEVVTQRDVLISTFIDSISDPQKKSVKSVTLTPAELSKELNGLLVELMVDRETPPASADADEKKTLENLWSQVSGDSFTAKFALKQKELEKVYLRKKRVRAFMDLKLASLVQDPSADEVKNYYESNKSRFGDVPLAQVENNIRTFLMQNQREAKVKTWFEGLRRKYHAQNYISTKETK